MCDSIWTQIYLSLTGVKFPVTCVTANNKHSWSDKPLHHLSADILERVALQETNKVKNGKT